MNKKNLKVKKVIAAIIVNPDQKRILIAQRAKKDSLYGKWEFPGGKMEKDETEHQCLSRELNEEFGIEALIGDYLCSSFFEYNNTDYEMKAFFVKEFKGDFSLFDHLAIKWVKPSELLNYDMPAADKPIVDKLLEIKS